MKKACLIALMLAGTTVAAQAQEERHGGGWHNPGGGHRPGGGWGPGARWQLLGSKTVDGGRDHDAIMVSSRNEYYQLQLCAANAPIHIVGFKVMLGNLKRQDIRVRGRIAPGTCTRDINLEGQTRRRIIRIDLTYEPILRGGRPPLVRVMGR